jgi:ABC-type glutathione transport system ATPase component
MNKKEINQLFDQIVDFSEVGAFIDTPVKRYSSGMYVKLAFSVAAHLRSEIVIMDEVLAVGDVNFQNKCIAKMNEVSRSEGRTILYVSHNMNTIRQLCERCIVLNKGELIYSGGVEESIKHYMGAIKTNYETHFDTRNNERTSNANGQIRINSISLVNKEINIYETKEPIRVSCQIESNRMYKEVRLMMIIFSKEGIPLGMSESGNFQICEGESDIEFIFDPQVLPDGQYFTELNIVERNSFGGYDKYEGVCEAFAFYIENPQKLVIGSEWNSAVFGNTFYNQIQVLER